MESAENPMVEVSSSDVEEDDYDPSNILDPNAAAAAERKAPVTIGGFVEDEEEDKDDGDAVAVAPPAAGSEGQAVAVAPSVKSPSQAPLHVPVPTNANVSDVSDTLDTNTSRIENGTPITPADDSAAKNDGSAEGRTAVAIAAAAASQTDATLAQEAPRSALPQAPLPHDVVGLLELKIKSDPKGDLAAWHALIWHHRSKQRYDEARKAYERFFQVFPSAANEWLAYAHMEQELDDITRLEAIFNTALMKVQSIPLWSMYLDHVRRRNDISSDNGGRGREVITAAYKFVIDQTGIDPESGRIWEDYMAFLKSGPGSLTGTGWQDKQKVDKLRPEYQAAICVPVYSAQAIWKDYSDFENTANRINARKILQEKSPGHVTARHTYAQLSRIMQNIKRGETPRLPPLPGSARQEESDHQLRAWREWIAFELSDPLVLKEEDNHNLFRKRVLHAYRQAVMVLRFYPEIWYEAAQFCFDNTITENGVDVGADFLARGGEANPESPLLAFARADRIERVGSTAEGENGAKKLGDAVRAPYDVTLNALYALIKQNTEQEASAIAKVEESFAEMTPESGAATPNASDADEDAQAAEDVDDDDGPPKPLTRKQQKERAIKAINDERAVHFKTISMVITYVWIGLMRTMRRVQGKGKPGEVIGGMRQIFFNEARKRGRVLGDFWIAGALMEHHCYQDQAALKIFERGLKLFPEDENFTLEYIKHLINTGDVTNARAVFETTVARITSKPTAENLDKAKCLYHFFHDFEAKYGELAQIRNLETRMAQLFPEDASLALFAKRYYSPQMHRPSFDPCKVQLLLSPSQVEAAVNVSETVVATVEDQQPAVVIPQGYTQSPKRPLEDSDIEQPVRKLIRGESPLKGAAGRRQQQRQAREQQQQYQQHGVVVSNITQSGPKPLPAAVYGLLSIMPPARQWTEMRFDAQKMVDLVRSVDLTKAVVSGQAGFQHGR